MLKNIAPVLQKHSTNMSLQKPYKEKVLGVQGPLS